MALLIDHGWPGNIRELKNLVESMVVLAPGRVIRPEDIPDEVRGRGTSLLPAAIPRGTDETSGKTNLRPELEFIFRTLVELRVDMDDLKRDFEAYRGGFPMSLHGEAILGRVQDADHGEPRPDPRGIEIPAYSPGAVVEELADADTSPAEEEGVIVFRPGMTIEDMEREAIAAVLDQVHGNRRKAAELLGIGERTLYRKISKYGLEA